MQSIRINSNPFKGLNPYFIGGLTLIGICYLPIFFFQENSIVIGHDNVDCDLSFKSILKTSGHLFCVNPNHEINAIFQNFKVNYIHSAFNFSNLFYYFFSTFWAYILNGLFARIIGYTGAYYLLKNYSSIQGNRKLLLLSLMYALMPFYSAYGISIMGLPFLYLSFMYLSQKDNIFFAIGYILFYSAYAHFFLVGPFLILFFCTLMFQKKNQNWHYFFGVCLLGFGFLLFNALFLYEFLLGELSHRVEFFKISSDNKFSLASALYEFIVLFFTGIAHFSNFFIGPLLIYIIFSKYSWVKLPELFAIIIISAWVVVYEHYLPSVGFNITRFTVLFPLLILILYAKLVRDKSKFWDFGKYIVLLQILININNDIEIGGNIKRLLGFKSETYIQGLNEFLIEPFNQNIREDKWPFAQIASLGIFGADRQIRERVLGYEDIYFNAFYSKESFNEIKRYLGPQSKTLSVGFHPSITHFNQVNSLDSYQVFYPLKYKHMFREIIAPELNKSTLLKEYYDNWGNRVYAFSNELFQSCKFDCNRSVEQNHKIEEIGLDLGAFANMGGSHIISAVEILNAAHIGLNFIDKIDHPKSRYVFYLYGLEQD